MVSQGNFAGASSLATTPGVLKPSLAGSQIKHLGQGSEGLATLVAHPDHGVAVRKLYDPRGISGPEMIARKEQAGKALGDNPNFAKFLGSAQTPQGGNMHFNEYVPTGSAPFAPNSAAETQSIKHTTTQANLGLNQAGFAGGKDIRRGNMVYDAASGKHRVIDYMPAQKNEFMRMPANKSNVIAQTPGSDSPFNKNYSPEGSGTQGGMLGRLIGGRSQMGGVRAGESNLARGTAPTALATAPKTSPLSMGGTRANSMGGTPSATAQTQLAKPPPSSSSSVSTTPLKPTPPTTTPLQPPKPIQQATQLAKPKPVSPLAPAQT